MKVVPSVKSSGALLFPTRTRYSPLSTTHLEILSSQYDTAYLSSDSVTTWLVPGSRSFTFAKALSINGGCVSSDVEGKVTYSWTISEPDTGPVFDTVTLAVRLNSSFDTEGAESVKSEYLNVVYERP